MAAQKKDIQINLLPKDKFAGSPLGRILKWLLSTFRIMVIVVEMVVMLAFFSRFWLDARNSDLNDEIKQKTAQISAFATFEKQYKTIQERLRIFQALASDQKYFSGNLNLISSYLPADVFISTFSASGNEIGIAGISPSEQSISQFIVNLENDTNIEKVTLTQIDTGEKYEGLIGFGLVINMKKGAL
ncbi:MAG TPA: PilN domain-containing protein [Patescibacteria group bacterium]|nr:PilN domain-containing protein [Patescibacteria group bacterium]